MMGQGRRLRRWLVGGVVAAMVWGTVPAPGDAAVQDRMPMNAVIEPGSGAICTSDTPHVRAEERLVVPGTQVAWVYESFAVVGGRAVTKENSSPCSEEMSDMGGFCIDKQPSPGQANWYDAADFCQARGKRLCTNEEWLQACDASPINAVAAMPGLEWLANWVFETSEKVFDAMDHGYFRCRTSSQPRPASRPFEVRKFRCCR